ncbi:polysaccharide biosynthesis/export family protein [Rubripirellula reticaptiva]|uniref:Polysaccharide biosynthesis/export protein n=1 Tax=Rubripirellula reticaptiva TaxID=2528013 RepID=A0A5C6EQ33_9BACT|nr:polysaccharide biosynthesis/export family protein [Rubripirellula reticaptiva]TWU51883.1 Polysaccharide biosynthesis/export protein [Rubripirellula reticaptiva]
MKFNPSSVKTTQSARCLTKMKSVSAGVMFAVGLCAMATQAVAQQGTVSVLDSADTRIMDLTDNPVASPCGCQSTPGGYPCVGGCQKCMIGVDCRDNCGAEARWRDIRPMPFDAYGPGGYAGPSRFAHLSEYRLRPGDQVQVLYLITRRQRTGEYKLTPGDEVLIESGTDADLTRGSLESGLMVQPDGTITVRMLGQVHAAGLTVAQLREILDEEYSKFVKQPSIDVTPVKTNTLAEDIRNAVGGQSGFNQQSITVEVTPDGKVRLPGIGEVCVQGFSLNQLKREINLRYKEIVVGIDTEPILTQQAPHQVHVLGQVNQPGRIQLDAPTTVLGAIASAGGHQIGGNLRQVVVFRRAEDWRLISTVLDLQGAMLGKRPTPADEIWLRDGDVIIVPNKPITRFNNWAQQIFTDGLYRIFPVQFNGLNDL